MNLAKGNGAMELPKFTMPKFAIGGMSDELQKRIISAGLLAPLVLIFIYFGGTVYNALIVAVAVIMSFEWQSIINSGNRALTEPGKQKWAFVGIVYITIFATSLIYLRNLESGCGIVLLLLLTVWATDIAAFFTGRFIKGPKICTKISPNKTWSGLIGGMIAAGLVGAIASFAIAITLPHMVAFGMLIAVISQIGDFFESWVKRSFGVKDSGNIIPGHGGLLDRLDGFTTAAPVFVILTLIYA